MFNWNYKNKFSFFISDYNNKLIPISNWTTVQSEYLSQLSILKELHDNGFAEYSLDTCEVEVNEILRLSEIDKKILSLPDHYPYEIYIESDGQLNQSEFKFRYGFFDFVPNGNRFVIKRSGAIVEIDTRQYLLSENQFLVIEAIDGFNTLPNSERTFSKNLKHFSEIKNFSKEAATLLDSYLQNQEVYLPDKIKVNIAFENNTLEITPALGIERNNDFLKVFDTFQGIREVYPIRDSQGQTTRVVFDEKQKNELEKLKKKRKINDPNEIAEIVEHPENYFDDEVIDISIFYSERVKEIGVYKPKFYPFVCPYKSEWIPGIAIKDKVQGEKRIHFKTSIELKEFENEKRVAEGNGNKSFSWQGSEIPIEDANKFISIAKKQFENPSQPVSKTGKSDDEVLIVKENAEFLEYVEEISTPIKLNHSFTKLNNLNPILELKDHQIEGIAWLQTLFKEKLSGCLLADDMGLGKTLQLLYFIEWHSKQNIDAKPYLVVAPVTLLENWENEYENYFSPPNLPMTLLYKTFILTKEFSKQQVEQLQKKQIILTNYETLRTYQFNLCAVDYAVVVLDEAQKIKTPGTLITNVSKALKADFKIAMTGTPVENTLVDIWCIMDYSVPGLLGNAKEFAKEFQNPMKDENISIKELGDKLRKKIGIFIKRRLKHDVAKDLPKKYDDEKSKIKRSMPERQYEQYKIEIERAKNSDLKGIDKRNQILQSLWAIRDISDHPYLVHSQISNFTSDELISTSAKLQILIELLSNIKTKMEKAIIYADRKETQKMLQRVIFDYFNILPSIVNGETPSIKTLESKTKLSRQQTIDRFQIEDGFNVIVMSPLAAGVGLNVTSANHVIHFTRHWNPAKEEQATDRAYRIGQKKDVYVYYPMAVSDEFESFDIVLDKLLARKKSLASHTLFPTEQAEVRPDDIFDGVFGVSASSRQTPLTLKEVDNLNPNLFEAYIAALYSKQGFITHLTPYSNDKGVDVVALKDSDNYLIQAKQSRSIIGNDAVQEIYAAKNYYEEKYGEKFSLLVISNNNFSSSAEILSRTNEIKLLNRIILEHMILQNNVSIQDVNRFESQRMRTI